MQPRCRGVMVPCRSSSRRSMAARSRSKATRSIPIALAPPMPSPRRLCSIFTIPPARSVSCRKTSCPIARASRSTSRNSDRNWRRTAGRVSLFWSRKPGHRRANVCGANYRSSSRRCAGASTIRSSVKHNIFRPRSVSGTAPGSSRSSTRPTSFLRSTAIS